MTKQQLKPCPFCSGEARVIKMAKGYSASCKDCGAEMVLFDNSNTTCQSFKTKLNLIDSWNTRTENTQQELINELVETIEAAMRIKDLWLPQGAFADNPPENVGEMEALCIMGKNFESILSKAKGGE